MKRISRAIRAVAALLIIIGMPIMAHAFTPGNFSVSPQLIDIGTIRVLPGSSAGPYSFTISVVGGPVADPATDETATYQASSDASWLALDPVSGDVPGTITATATVSETMGEGTWTANITISSGLDSATTPVTVSVEMRVVRSIGDLLTVSPTAIDLTVTEENIAQQSIPITIANADPEKPVFDWSAVSNVAWLNLSKTTGDSNETISMTLNPDLLMLTVDSDDDGTMDQATGSITVRSNIHPEPVTIDVNLTMTVSDENQVKFSVSPSQLSWSVEKDAGSTASLTFNSQILHIWSQGGWMVSFDAPYLSVNATTADGGTVLNLATTELYGRLEITPIADVLETMAYGTYTTYITITDYYNLNQQQIPVSINIRQPGEQVVLPTVYQIASNYSLIEAANASLINLKIPLAIDFEYYSTAGTCQAGGGSWLDPDGVSGNLDEYCSLNEHFYVLIEQPEMNPGVVYIMDGWGQISVAYWNGVMVPGADNHSYADGPVPEVGLGPMQLLGCYGRFTVSYRLGTTLSSSVEIQRVQVNLKTPVGAWQVTETFQGENYSYDSMLLQLNRIPGQYAYWGTWGDTTVTMVPGDGANMLYQLIFSESGMDFLYEVQDLSATMLSGRWRFSWPGGVSNWETFSAQRMLWVP